MVLGEHAKAVILDVVQECQMELFSSYQKQKSSLSSKSDTTSDTAIGEPQDALQQTSEVDFQKMDQWNGSSTDVVSGWGNSTLFSGFSAYAEAPEKEYHDFVDFQVQLSFPTVTGVSSKSSAPSHWQDTGALGTMSVLSPWNPFT
jgi:hypothetical protein